MIVESLFRSFNALNSVDVILSVCGFAFFNTPTMFKLALFHSSPCTFLSPSSTLAIIPQTGIDLGNGAKVSSLPRTLFSSIVSSLDDLFTTHCSL